MKIIDSFTFFNELDMLKLRLHYLHDVVDYFIISESNYTHSGKIKPYYMDNILSDIPDYILKKIIRVKYEPDIDLLKFDQTITEYTPESIHWKLEKEQRECIIKYISNNYELFSDDDYLVISDVDEIPKKEILSNLSNFEIDKYICSTISLDCKMFYYNFTTYNDNLWSGPVISNILNFKNNGIEFFRTNRFALYNIKDAAWHFSYFGGAEQIKNKLESFAHQEYNNKNYNNDERLMERINDRINLFDDKKFIKYDFNKFPEDLKNLIIKIFTRDYYV